MKSAPRFVVSLVLSFAAGVLHAADDRPLYSIVSASVAPRPAGSGELQIAALNTTGHELVVAWPAALRGSLSHANGRSEVAVQRDDTTSATERLAAGGFGMARYSFTLPTGAALGEPTLEIAIEGAGRLRAVLEIAVASATPAAHAGSTPQRPTTNLVRARTAAAALRRTFADRIGAHEPIYFIYGPDDPAAKFQFSFKYKLLDITTVTHQRMARTLQFAFTQRSVWNIDGVSSPFYDTSYMPEIVYESLAPEPEQSDRWFTWLGVQAAFKHESNGRDGPVSRSLNVVYARPVLAFGRLDGWHLLAIPEVFTYVDTLEDNPDIKDYRGHGKLHLVFGRNDGPSLMASIWAGHDFNHGTVQLDLTFPVRTRLLNFETYLLIQYFNGHGESLLSYRQKSETLRAGFSLVR